MKNHNKQQLILARTHSADRKPLIGWLLIKVQPLVHLKQSTAVWLHHKTASDFNSCQMYCNILFTAQVICQRPPIYFSFFPVSYHSVILVPKQKKGKYRASKGTWYPYRQDEPFVCLLFVLHLVAWLLDWCNRSFEFPAHFGPSYLVFFRNFPGINRSFGLLSFDGCYSQTEESAKRSVRATSGALAADHGLARFNPVYSVWFTSLLVFKKYIHQFSPFLWRNLWQNVEFYSALFNRTRAASITVIVLSDSVVDWCFN